jgi:hypothetical protein
MATALQKYAWDENTGYYGYVTHNTSGTPIDIMKYKNKVNYNMGLGGTSPLVSGIATPKQQQKMVNHLKNPKEIWTDVGLSAVDQSAPYFKIDGYWNGTVWMPHQWFMWKAMLDIGEDDFAYKIAKTALEVWKRETEDSYNCYEHFVIASGKGAGWHQFSGLSAPVLAWFNAYFKPGTLTTGLDAWITNKTFNKTNTHLKTEVMIEDQDADKFSLVVCMNPNYVYEVFWNGKIQNYNQLHKGTLSITLSKRLKSKGLLEVRIKQ